MSTNKTLITSEVERLEKEIKKMDEKIVKEVERFKEVGVLSKSLEKLATLKADREKLQHTQTTLWAILGQWKDGA